MWCFVGNLLGLFFIGAWDVRKHSDFKACTVAEFTFSEVWGEVAPGQQGAHQPWLSFLAFSFSSLMPSSSDIAGEFIAALFGKRLTPAWGFTTTGIFGRFSPSASWDSQSEVQTLIFALPQWPQMLASWDVTFCSSMCLSHHQGPPTSLKLSSKKLLLLLSANSRCATGPWELQLSMFHSNFSIFAWFPCFCHQD